MSTMISLQTILWSALAAAAGIGLPVLVLLVWKFKFCRGAKLFPAVVGAVTFVVFAQVLEGVPKAIFFGGGTGVSQCADPCVGLHPDRLPAGGRV